MSDSVLTTLISSGFILLGTIITVLVSAMQTRNKTGNKIDAVETALKAHIKDDEWAMAKQCRIRILRFWDEVCAGVQYSENHWEEALDDIDFYTTFCANHPDYHNSKGTIAMRGIEAKFDELKRTNNFLK